MNKQPLENFRNILGNGKINLMLNFDIPKEISEAGLVITDINFSDIEYDKNLVPIGGKINALVTHKADYLLINTELEI